MAQRVSCSPNRKRRSRYCGLDRAFPFVFRPNCAITSRKHRRERQLAFALFCQELGNALRHRDLTRLAVFVFADGESPGPLVERTYLESSERTRPLTPVAPNLA